MPEIRFDARDSLQAWVIYRLDDYGFQTQGEYFRDLAIKDREQQEERRNAPFDPATGKFLNTDSTITEE